MSTGKNVKDFQAKVGVVSGQIGLIIAYICGSLMIIGGIISIVYGYTPQTVDCVSDTDCVDDENDKCNNGKCSEKQKNTGYALAGWAIMVLGIIWIILAYFWLKWQRKSKNVAAVGGTLFEAGILSSIIR